MEIIAIYLKKIFNTFDQKKHILNRYDANIGDGDHGTNVCRGLKSIVDSMGSKITATSSISQDLMFCASQLMSKIGGSSGPLLATCLMTCAAELKDKTSIDQVTLKTCIEKCIVQICRLGKSKVGEKTMLDALDSVVKSLNSTNDPVDWKKVAYAANDGAVKTIALQATKGRASYLGERSVGHQDPGATSVALLFEAIAGISILEDASQTEDKEVHAKSNVNILIISHSYDVAKSVTTFVSEMKNGDYTLDYVGGIENHTKFGTDVNEIKAKIEKLTEHNELLIIPDLGSSKLNTDLALKTLPENITKKIAVATCAFLEGSLTAVVSNVNTTAKDLKELVENQVKVNK